MANKALSDPRSLHLPNTGDLRQPRFGKTIKPPKAVKVGPIKTRVAMIKLTSLLPKRYR